MPLRFTSKIQIRGVNPFISVSAQRANSLKPNHRTPLPVLVRINSQPKTPWRINMMPTGDGRFYLYLHTTIRKASATKVGDRVHVELQFDSTYRNGPQHPMRPKFRSALTKTPKAKTAWNALPPSRQKELLRYFANLKSPEAQKRNLARAIHVLSGNPARFMGRDWKDGR
jgi:Domain of unknown function (DUF1905)/Bacteriocin-protection, YdeI or OmpD-Associated